MMKVLFLILFFALLSGQLVSGFWTWYPDYERGRRLEKRWSVFNESKSLNKWDIKIVEGICGKVYLEQRCTKVVGRPIDSEVENCDRFCCQLGYLTGTCETNIGFKLSQALEMLLKNAPGNVSIPLYNSLGQSCKCSNERRDASCGPSNPILGITCPDKSACARYCCWKGYRGSSCGGFLWLYCNCNND